MRKKKKRENRGGEGQKREEEVGEWSSALCPLGDEPNMSCDAVMWLGAFSREDHGITGDQQNYHAHAHTLTTQALKGLLYWHRLTVVTSVSLALSLSSFHWTTAGYYERPLDRDLSESIIHLQSINCPLTDTRIVRTFEGQVETQGHPLQDTVYSFI